MKMKAKSFYCKAASLMLAVVMIFSVITVFPQDVNAMDKPLPGKNGGVVSISDDEASSDIIMIPFTASADGYLQVVFSNNTTRYNYSVGLAQLYDSNKSTALSKSFEYNTNSTVKGFYSEYYGVKKKKTYYIAVLASGGVNVSVQFKKLKDKGATKEKKACNIKKGNKGVTGVITAGTTTAHWYKFTMPKVQKLNCKITPWCTDSLTFTIKGPGLRGKQSGTIIGRYSDSMNNYLRYWGKPYPLTTNSAIRGGTYYVSVKPATRQATGYYKISWK